MNQPSDSVNISNTILDIYNNNKFNNFKNQSKLNIGSSNRNLLNSSDKNTVILVGNEVYERTTCKESGRDGTVV